MKRIGLFAISVLATIIIFSLLSPKTFALTFDEFVEGVKDVFTNDTDKNIKNKTLTIDSNINLAQDVNKNGQIDAGDIVKFTFILTNTTDVAYTYATLDTHINRTLINNIHAIKGTTGISNTGKTVLIPNIRLLPQSQKIISFNAIINLYQEDKIISVEPEFIDSNKKSVSKEAKKDIKATKLTKEEVTQRGFIIKN